MASYQAQVKEAARYVRHYMSGAEIGVMTGTGLGESIRDLDVHAAIEYRDIPNFPVSTVQSHYGKLVAGELYGQRILAMQGRFHLYEGYSPAVVTFPIRVMQAMGVRTLVLSNAAGGINLDFLAGDIMLITDHINMTGENPLIGPNIDQLGIRFPDMLRVYDSDLIKTAEKTAQASGFSLKRGVYIGLKGPSLETPSETRFLRNIGGDAVGFSTVMEAIAGVHAGMRIIGLSTITNVNDPDQPEPATVEAIIDVARSAAPKHAQIIQSIASELSAHGTD
ncbi:MAG TPA: purine-nucleoside phosphorylase [Desulfosalsimonadaceae bacterium]|nr:purine-nucleoside phosphorylase [Desulfosalsimonadaceae bacterium]